MPALVKMDGLKFSTTAEAAIRKLGNLADVALAATTQAMVEYAEYLLALMQQLAPKKTGALIEGGHVLPPRIEGDFVVVQIVWDEPYSQIQDAGGIVLPKNFRSTVVYPHFGQARLKGKGGKFITKRQQNTARLFIPLRPGVYPIADPAQRKAAGFKIGIDFVLSRSALIHGNRFISNVMLGEVGVSGIATEDGTGANRVGGGGEAKNAPRTIGQIAERIFAAMTEAK